ncbi:MAG: DUF3798 domain-containing protein [Clostridia bacterium]|nr:DUF3798 domain-containing protein [Clostridia bacterium]
MFKKITAILMAFTFIFTLASCGKGSFLDRFKTPPVTEQETEAVAEPVISEDIPEISKKIVILVPAGEQFNEGIMAADMLQKKYADNVIVKEYQNNYTLADNLGHGVIDVAAEVAADKSVGAIVFAKSTRLTNEAITAARGNNPELKIICIEPEDSVDKIAAKCDLVLCVDWVSAANDMVALAKSQGATQFLMMSFDRHIGSGTNDSDNTSLLAATAKSAISAACQNQEIEFIYHNCPDPISADGTKAVKKDIRDSLTRYKESGKIAEESVALFSTDYFIQNELINIANENKYVYVSPAFPTAYNGICDLYSVELPENPYSTGSFKADVASATVSAKAILGYYNYPLETVLLTGAVHTAFDMLAGKTTANNMADRVAMRLNDAAASKDFAVKSFGSGNNIYTAYCPAFEALH